MDLQLFYEKLLKLNDWALKVWIIEALGLARVTEFEFQRKIEELEHLFVDAGISLSHDDPQSFKDFREVRENIQKVVNQISTKVDEFDCLGEAALRRYVDEDGILVACDDAMTFQVLHLQCKVQDESFVAIRRKAFDIRKRMDKLLHAMTAQEEEE